MRKAIKGAKRLSFEQSVLYLCSQISDEFIRHIDAVDVYRYRREQIEAIIQNRYSRYFGFTESEVWDMLHYYELPDSLFQEIHDWYDGYSFGESSIYNPWSVLQTVKAAFGKEAHYLMPYWSNTSSNNIVRSLIEQADI